MHISLALALQFLVAEVGLGQHGHGVPDPVLLPPDEIVGHFFLGHIKGPGVEEGFTDKVIGIKKYFGEGHRGY